MDFYFFFFFTQMYMYIEDGIKEAESQSWVSQKLLYHQVK